MALNDIYKNGLKVPYSDSDGGGDRVKMSPDTILTPPQRQKNFSATAAVCKDLITLKKIRFKKTAD